MVTIRSVRDAGRVVEPDSAVRTVEEELDREYQRELSVGIDPIRMAVSRVERHKLVWIASWTSEEYLHTRNPDLILAGNGPYLVDRVDGSLHQIGVVSAATAAWEADYRVRVRGQVMRSAVDDLHDEVRAVAAARGRVHAMHTLRRRVSVLSHAQIIECVTALQHGDPPAHLVEVATNELVPLVDPVLSVATVHGRGGEVHTAPPRWRAATSRRTRSGELGPATLSRRSVPDMCQFAPAVFRAT